jgi:hypothetical protein
MYHSFLWYYGWTGRECTLRVPRSLDGTVAATEANFAGRLCFQRLCSEYREEKPQRRLWRIYRGS